MKSRIPTLALAFGLMLFAFVGTALARDTAPIAAKNVVLVHGAWADVSPHLRAAGLKGISVQNPLTSLSDDVAATNRALALLEGPRVLVGHSYAGSVIS